MCSLQFWNRIQTQSFQKVVLGSAANVAVAFISYAVLAQLNMILALAAFMTASRDRDRAPVIIGFIGREVEYVVASVVLTKLQCNYCPLALQHCSARRFEYRLGSIAPC